MVDRKRKKKKREREWREEGGEESERYDGYPIIAEDRLVRPKIVHVEPRHRRLDHLALKIALPDKPYHSPNEHDSTRRLVATLRDEYVLGLVDMHLICDLSATDNVVRLRLS